MTEPASFAERLGEAFRPSPEGVVGLVDRLLELARERQLTFNFRYGELLASWPEPSGSHIEVAAPIPKSVFRALLARLATLGKERGHILAAPAFAHTSLSSGEFQMVIGPGSRYLINVHFVNNADEPYLRLTCPVEGEETPDRLSRHPSPIQTPPQRGDVGVRRAAAAAEEADA